jgi:hypothetical protein
VTDERALAKAVIERLESERAHRDRLRLEIVAWDKPGSGIAMPAHLEPQEALERDLRKPSDCDIVVVIFGYRMGTPLSGKYRKQNGERYWSGTEYEYCDALSAAQERDTPKVLVYRKQGAPSVNLADPKYKDIEEQWKRVEAFFASFKKPDGSFRRYYKKYDTSSQFKDRLDEDLRDIIAQYLEKEALGSSQLVSSLLTEKSVWHESPYPGLRPFGVDEAPIFFGRDRETDELVQRLTDPTNRLLLIVGSSGSGKSSLVAAGLLPRLQDNAVPGSENWVLDIRFTPAQVGDNALMALASQLALKLEKQNIQPRELAAELAIHPGQLNEVVEFLLQGRPHWAELLLFMDQFEELFTLVAPSHQESFISLIAVAAKMSRVRMVATLRADFYHRCLEHEKLTELLRTGSYPLAVPGIGALHEMITRPAKRAGLTFENGLVERILNDTGTAPGGLPLMAAALAELYDRRNPEWTLSHATYDSFEGVQGIISQRAEKVYSKLQPDAQKAMNEVFRELVEVDERGIAIRRRAVRRQVCRSPAAEEFVDRFTDARLLVTTDEKGQPIVEVAHEALLRRWPRLEEWINTVTGELTLLRQVQTEAARWDKQGRPKILLWPHERLLLVEHMIESLRPELNNVERTFVRPEIERLKEELESPTTNHYRRAEIGDRLASISDSRPGVGLGPDSVPCINWVRISGGRIELDGDAGASEVEPFHIARYPITWTQYQVFLESEDGYFNNRWWQSLRREKDYGRQYRPVGNCPAENVSWFDAVAFCRWLTARLGFGVRLPCEFEWQLAATGGDKEKMYPWGKHWESGRTNTRESGLQRTIAVGMYPQGVSPLGVMDMAGNVWEWCLNKYRNPGDIRIGGKIHIDCSEARCVVRGGSWHDDRYKAYSSYRSYGPVHPRNRFNYIGFRIVCYRPI